MDPTDIGLLFLSVILALISRSMMKRYLSRKTGKVVVQLLEIDFWKATSGDILARCLLLVELLSWAATVVLVAILASLVLSGR